MPNTGETSRALSAAQIDQFIQDGFVKIEHAFPREFAEDARSILWKDTGCDPVDASTWTTPVIRLGMYAQEPFVKAANTPVLHQAFDQLAGAGRWSPCKSMGTFPVRFPSSDDPGDAGWHIDVSFGFENSDFMSWRANIHSKGRALLMLFLFSDVGEDDAPTRIRRGSHIDIARKLAPAGEAGLSLRELATNGFEASAHRHKRWRRATREQSISAIRFSCMRRNRIAGDTRASWRSRRCCRAIPSATRSSKAETRLLSAP